MDPRQYETYDRQKFVKKSMGGAEYLKMEAKVGNGSISIQRSLPHFKTLASQVEIDTSKLSPVQRDLVNKDRLQIQYQKFKIAKIAQDRARIAQTELGMYGGDAETDGLQEDPLISASPHKQSIFNRQRLSVQYQSGMPPSTS